MTFLDIAIIVIVVIIVNIVFDKLSEGWKYRYGWECPEDGCIFKVRANDQKVIARITEAHQDAHK